MSDTPEQVGPSAGGLSGEDILRQHLRDLGPSAEAVRAFLRAAGHDRPDAAENVRAYLMAAGWRDVVLEPLGDTGWLYARAVAPGGEAVAVDLPEPVVGYVNVTERTGGGRAEGAEPNGGKGYPVKSGGRRGRYHCYTPGPRYRSGAVRRPPPEVPCRSPQAAASLCPCRGG